MDRPKLNLKPSRTPCFDCRERDVLSENGVYGCRTFCIANLEYEKEMRLRKQLKFEYKQKHSDDGSRWYNNERFFRSGDRDKLQYAHNARVKKRRNEIV